MVLGIVVDGRRPAVPGAATFAKGTDEGLGTDVALAHMAEPVTCRLEILGIDGVVGAEPDLGAVVGAFLVDEDIGIAAGEERSPAGTAERRHREGIVIVHRVGPQPFPGGQVHGVPTGARSAVELRGDHIHREHEDVRAAAGLHLEGVEPLLFVEEAHRWLLPGRSFGCKSVYDMANCLPWQRSGATWGDGSVSRREFPSPRGHPLAGI